MAVFNCKGTQMVWTKPKIGRNMMKVTFNQLICLYQLDHVIGVSVIWSFLGGSEASIPFERGVSSVFIFSADMDVRPASRKAIQEWNETETDLCRVDEG